MGDNFLQKSWLFEIVDSNSKILNSFTLIIPPNGISIKEKARVTITKTFGNAFIDDYGPDNLEITIKGISGTAHVFPTYRTSGQSQGAQEFATNPSVTTASAASGTEGYDGKGAFYTFRDEIMRYRDHDNFDQMELRVYDFADEQAYKCVLLEFDLDRSSDKPFWYPFTISLFVYARLDSKNASNSKKIDFTKNPLIALANLRAGLTMLENNPIFKAVQSLKNGVATAAAQINLLSAQFNTFLEDTTNFLETPLFLAKTVLSTLRTLSSNVHNTLNLGKIVVNDYATGVEVINAMTRETLGLYGIAIQQGSNQSQTKTLQQQNGYDFVNGEPIAQETTFTFTGVIKYTVQGADSLQSIAQDKMGDETLWPYIAELNSISGNADIYSGMELYIPISTPQTTQKDAFIITEDPNRDAYGADIRLDSDGNIVIQESGDIALVSGVDNVVQSINSRLSTPVGAMIKQTAYGFQSQVGIAGTSMAISYVRMAFVAALMQDPRIDSVENVIIGNVDESDSMGIQADITPIGYDTSLPVTSVLGGS